MRQLFEDLRLMLLPGVDLLRLLLRSSPRLLHSAINLLLWQRLPLLLLCWPGQHDPCDCTAIGSTNSSTGGLQTASIL